MCQHANFIAEITQESAFCDVKEKSLAWSKTNMGHGETKGHSTKLKQRFSG